MSSAILPTHTSPQLSSTQTTSQSAANRPPGKSIASNDTITAPTPVSVPTSEFPPKSTRAKRKRTQENANANAGAIPQDLKSQSEPAMQTKKRRKKRRGAETAEQEGPIDPTQVTMGDICDDLGSGRMSSRWETSQAFYAESRKRAREERTRAIAEAVKEERETGRAGAHKGIINRPTLPSENEAAVAGAENVVENTRNDPDEFSYNESLKESHYAPQVRIGANGEVVLDMESLQVDRAADPEMAEETYSFVEESDQTKFTNSNSWSKRRSVRWRKEDTAMFYDALRQFGHNFDLIARVLPGRTYQMCKNKFKAEDKKNPHLIDDALKNGIAVDLNTLSRMTGKDFSGPTPTIEAKKTLSLGEHHADTEPAAPDKGEVTTEVAKENQTPGAVSNQGKGEDETPKAD